MTRLAMILFGILLLLPSINLHARIIRVPGDKPTIQGGINVAADGDTVLIAPGTYPEGAIDFLGKAIVVTGTNPEDSVVVGTTIVEGGGSPPVFHFHSGEKPSSMLAGLTITNHQLGGIGIKCDKASPTITHNVIRDNGSHGINSYDSSPVITRNTIRRNSSGIYNSGRDSWPVIYNNRIKLNNTDSGIRIYDSSPLIANNLIWDNYSGTSYYYYIVSGYGGGIYCSGGSPVIINNLIHDNGARNGGYGAGIYLTSSEAILANNIIRANYASDYWDEYGRRIAYGGGIACFSSRLRMSNNTITGNTAEGVGGGLYCRSSSDYLPGSKVSAVNSIFWDNTAEEGPEIALRHIGGSNSTTLNISFSDVEGGRDQVHIVGEAYLNWGSGMIEADPLFTDDLYHLDPASPCVDTGAPNLLDACRPPGLGGERSDMGAYGGEENCGWDDDTVDVLIFPDTLEPVRRGETVTFHNAILNRTEENFEGDFWLSVMLPDSSENLVPEAVLQNANPRPIDILPLSAANLESELIIHSAVDTGTYQLISRIGTYPDRVVDEDRIGIRVYQPREINVPNEYRTIQGGIDASLDGDTVMVADGIYKGEGNRDIEIRDKSIVVMSENGPEVTIIDCEGSSGDPHRGFYLTGSESPSHVIQGFTITNGFETDGGGIYCGSLGSLIVTVTECIITGNTATNWDGGRGGGIYCHDWDQNSTITLTDCVIAGNSVQGHVGVFGAGISTRGFDVVIRDCVIAGNSMGYSANAHGGGIHLFVFSYAIISGSTIVGNSTFDEGGGIYIRGSLPPEITNSIIWDNSPDGISGPASVTYSDIQGGWEGEGNIDADPMLLLPERGDTRLLWGSPCIDTGHPDSLDPDMTRRDMGAFYYDQNELVTLYLTPDATEIGPGDSLGVTYTLINRWSQPQTFFLETDVILPGGREYPLFGPDEYTLPGGTTDQFRLAHEVPAFAPPGWYDYWSRTLFPIAAVPGEDRFTFRVNRW